MKSFSSRMNNLLPSASIGMAETVSYLKSKGIEIIDMSWGEPDFPTPVHIISAAKEAMDMGETKYTSSRGISRLRTAISEKLERENNVTYSPNDEIIAVPGCKKAILYAFLTFLDHNDEVLIPEPCWLSYADQIAMAGGAFIPVPSLPGKNFKVTGDEIVQRLTDRTKIILINNPTNPTGSFWTREDLETIAEIVIEMDLIVISDDIYEKILFEGKQYINIASIPGMKERTIVINGFSKSYCMTGFRIGYAASSKSIISEMLKVQQHSATCASSVSQAAAVAALEGEQSFVLDMVGEYEKRRDLFVERINNIPGLSCVRPDGTFYAFVDIRDMNMSSNEAAKYMLEKYGIATVSGSSYGKSGEGFLRFSLTRDIGKIEEALHRMEKG